MAEAEKIRVIKRYANRKLYDTRDSRYVTLQLQPTVATLERPINTFTTSLGAFSTPVAAWTGPTFWMFSSRKPSPSEPSCWRIGSSPLQEESILGALVESALCG